MLVMEYNNNITGHPAMQGTEITFSCHPGFILLGPIHQHVRKVDNGNQIPRRHCVLVC